MRIAFVAASLIAGLCLATSAQAGKIQAFNYRSDKGLVRICKGDTSTGVAVCADGTAVSAVARGTAEPKWEVNDKARTYYLRYSMGQTKGAPGRYQFFVYYSNKGQVRVCAGDTSTGVANCVDGTVESASAEGTAEPKFKLSPKALTFMLRYFNPKKGKLGLYGFMSYRNNRNMARICRSDTKSGEVICVDGTAVSARVQGRAAPKWEVSEKAKMIYFKY